MAENINNIFVIDASFVLSYLLDEDNTTIDSIFEKQVKGEIYFISPSILKYEVGNALRTRLMRKKIKKAEAQRLYRFFLSINIKEEPLNFYDVLDLTFKKNLSFYDASYLYLAKSKGVKLLTLDHSLK